MLGHRFDDLLDRARAGDPLAFGEIWRDAQPMLLRYLRVVARDDAEDVASATWMRVIEGLDSFAGNEAGFRRWLVTLARDHSIELVRSAGDDLAQFRTGADRVASDGLPGDAGGVLTARMSAQTALELIGLLPTFEAELILLRVVMGFDVADMADVTGRTPGAIRVAVHGALERLEGALHAQPVGMTR